MNFLFLSYRGLGLSPLKLPSETVLVFSCQPRARRSRLHREAFLPRWAWWSWEQGES